MLASVLKKQTNINAAAVEYSMEITDKSHA
jgi:hypothetical protein